MTDIPEKILASTGIRTFELLVYVDVAIEGSMDDWPANVQDGIFKALEVKADEVQLPLTIIHSTCVIDYGDTEAQDRPYLHIIASEIIIADERELNDFVKDLDQLVADMLKKEGKLN